MNKVVPETGADKPCHDDRPSARDVRRTWVRLLPRQQAFHNPTAQLLAEFSDAVLSEEGWQGWLDRHPTGIDELPIDGAP